MKNTIHPIFALIILAFTLLLGGCKPAADTSTIAHTLVPSETTFFTPMPSATAIGTATPTFVPTGTPIATSTSVSTFTPTPYSVTGYKKICPPIEEMIPPGFLSEGMIILGSASDNDQLYALTDQDNNLYPLPDITDYGFLSVSPDGKWVAHDVEIEDSTGQPTKFLEVRSADSQQHWLIPFSENWRSPRYWVDTERIAIDYWRGAGQDDDWSTNYGEAIVNVFTSQATELDAVSLEFFSMPGTYPLYDHTLTRVLYPRYGPMEWPSLVLWDLQAKRELWRIEVWDTVWFVQPQWSPDGKQFVVGGPLDPYDSIYELLVVDRDGQATQLTHFKEAGLLEGKIYQPQWSPDGRHIAFWFDGSLAVFDTATEMITDYCISSSDATSTQPYWSPDSQQLAFTNTIEANTGVSIGTTRTIVVDIQENKAIEVARHYYVVGWMTMEQ